MSGTDRERAERLAKKLLLLLGLRVVEHSVAIQPLLEAMREVRQETLEQCAAERAFRTYVFAKYSAKEAVDLCRFLDEIIREFKLREVLGHKQMLQRHACSCPLISSEVPFEHH